MVGSASMQAVGEYNGVPTQPQRKAKARILPIITRGFAILSTFLVMVFFTFLANAITNTKTHLW